jgi:hypothetical protein
MFFRIFREDIAIETSRNDISWHPFVVKAPSNAANGDFFWLQ